MCKGFMLIPRDFRNWGWYRDSKMVHMLIHLMLTAQYQDSDYMGIKLKRGQLVTGRKKLSEETGLTEREVRTTIKRLENDQQIKIETTNKYSIVTLCNYEVWQGTKNKNDQQTTSKTPNKRPTDDHIQINKEDNNKEKEDTNVSKKELEQMFETFRQKYKSYGGKVRGFEVELKDLKNKHKDWEEVIPMLGYAIDKEAQERSAALRRGDFFPQIKNLKTYLNQRSWECYSDGFEDYNPNEYHPQDMNYDAEFKAYRFYGLQPDGYLEDGYDEDNRPDGARVVSQFFVWEWRKATKSWEEVK